MSGDDLRELLQHEDWIRRLARSLVADENRANELIQHVLTEALKNKPRNPKPWITVVMRAAVWRMRRSESRRKFRENAVARDEMQIPGVPQADQHETRERLVKLVQQLEPGYREVLLQHYFEDLTLEEIARRKGVPSATMRTRLRRALAQLREKLRAHYGDPAGWVFALVPISGIRSLSEIASTSSASRVHATGVAGKTAGSKMFFGAAAAMLLAGSAVGILALGGASGVDSDGVTVRAAGTSGALASNVLAREASGASSNGLPRVGEMPSISPQNASSAGGASLPPAPQAELVPNPALAQEGIFETLKGGTQQDSQLGSEALSIDQATGGVGIQSKGTSATIQPGHFGIDAGKGKGKLGGKKGKNSLR